MYRCVILFCRKGVCVWSFPHIHIYSVCISVGVVTHTRLSIISPSLSLRLCVCFQPKKINSVCFSLIVFLSTKNIECKSSLLIWVKRKQNRKTNKQTHKRRHSHTYCLWFDEKINKFFFFCFFFGFLSKKKIYFLKQTTSHSHKNNKILLLSNVFLLILSSLSQYLSKKANKNQSTNLFIKNSIL